MITKEQVRDICSKDEVQAVYQEVKYGLADFCRQFLYDGDDRVVRNALWVLTKAGKEEVGQLQPLRDSLIELAMSTPNSSVCRLSLNVVDRLTISREEIRADFLDFCIAHMMDVQACSANRSLCMKLAFRMCRFYPELMGELKRSVNSLF